jgi:hypothetical protein
MIVSNEHLSIIVILNKKTPHNLKEKILTLFSTEAFSFLSDTKKNKKSYFFCNLDGMYLVKK